MKKAIVPEQIDIALLCINGIGGNMNASETALLASELKASLTIPTYYGMFAENTVSPINFCNLCKIAGIETKLFNIGIKYNLT